MSLQDPHTRGHGSIGTRRAQAWEPRLKGLRLFACDTKEHLSLFLQQQPVSRRLQPLQLAEEVSYKTSRGPQTCQGPERQPPDTRPGTVSL